MAVRPRNPASNGRPYGTGGYGTGPWRTQVTANRPYGRFGYGTSRYMIMPVIPSYAAGAVGAVNFAARASPTVIRMAGAAGSVTFSAYAAPAAYKQAAAVAGVLFSASAVGEAIYAPAAAGEIIFSARAVLLKTWDTSQTAPCEPGAWLPLDCSQGVWTPADNCAPGTWQKAA